MSYVLGALPLAATDSVSDNLRRFLRHAISAYDLDIGRIYLDSEFYTEGAVKTLRAAEVDYLIQGKDTGEVEALLDEAPPGEVHTKTDIQFVDYEGKQRVNAFAWPVPPKELGTDDRDRAYYAFLTDMDLEEHDLSGLRAAIPHPVGY